VLLAVGLTGGGVLLARRGAAKSKPIDPALLLTVARRDLAVDILETGRIQAKDKADVKSKVAGEVVQVRVREGARVKKGDLLLVLDPTDYARDVARASADLAQARNSAAFTDLVLGRAKRGAAQQIVTALEVETKEHEAADQHAAVQKAEVALATADDRVRYTRIVAPMDGTITARNIEPGEVVTPGVQATFEGKPLLTVADLSTLLVRVNLNQIDVAKVAVGRKATLTLDALPGESYEALVTSVAPASVKLTGKDLEVFPVEATLAHTEAGDQHRVKPGMTADVRIHLDARPSVLVLPVEALVKEGAHAYVQRIVGEDRDGPKTDRVEVQLGARNDREVEITAGVADGDRLLLRPPSAAENEMKM
jgi:HlyD family secretion protein/macrolide-specific efflux system membrane fusion protein